ncbi:DUF3159 domain-containing protein [Pseudonocardia sp. N23]|uniref:DUF3159 domain-containing protein n=1 Tax=Pseudonocardia sp. N23 TaxID=1987376 RepID=UPI000C038656|nr:DUF3159 domain-containing protein [Pseudonocardia sp. N23]GAY10847.1 probable conserved integral membrane alanine and leucine rich protein [Pseudonocardia sp. N23]
MTGSPRNHGRGAVQPDGAAPDGFGPSHDARPYPDAQQDPYARPGQQGPADPPTDVFPIVGDDRPTARVPRVLDAEPSDRPGRPDAAADARDEDGEGGDGGAGRDGEARPEREMPTMLEQMGGVSGVVYSSVPVAVFIVVNILASLKPALFAAVGAGVAIAIVRIVRKEKLQPVVSALIGVAVCAFIANRSGQARDFYLPGLLLSAALGLACLVSVIARWPLAGVIWHGINGDGQGWRSDRRMLRAYMLATGLWALVFAARVVVQGWLYNVDEANWLGIARLLMGYPLMGVALLGTVLAVRWARRGTPATEPS